MKKSSKILLGLFVFWGVLILGWQVKASFDENKVFNDPTNRRNWSAPRKRILDRNGEILAATRNDARTYPLGEAASHVVGYVSSFRGPGGELEMKEVGRLVDTRSTLFNYFSSKDRIETSGIKSTIDAKLQKAIHQSLGSNRGAVVVLDAVNGEVLGMVSHPTYDPQKVEESWKLLNERKDTPLFNRATRGNYPPGSVWKTLIAAKLLDKEDRSHYCPGEILVENRYIKCAHQHGTVRSLDDAFARSCNTYFIARGMSELSPEEFAEISNKYLGTEISADLSGKSYAMSMIGQGPVLLSPINGALLAASIANGGKKPATTLILGQKAKAVEVMPEETANKLAKLMKGVVDHGTGRQLKQFLSKGEVGVKTGTAEYVEGGKKRNIGWMVGFARDKKRNPIAFAVVIEGTDEMAATITSPITQTILNRYFPVKDKKA